MPKSVIGICGKKFSGKSTLAMGLIGLQPSWTTIVIPFAAPLKLALTSMGLPAELFFDPRLKEKPHPLLQGKTPRHAMVTLGTEWGRDMIGENFWVDLWADSVHNSDHKYIIVDDVRFPQEVEAVRRVGGFVVAVERPEVAIQVPWWKFNRRKVHRSESLRYEDHNIPVLLNDGTPAELLEKFRALISRGT